MEKNNNHITLEDLAEMIKRGFDQMATKEELHGLRGTMQDMAEELNATHADVRYIRSTVDALVRSDIAQEASIQDLTARVHRLEQKAGLAK